MTTNLLHKLWEGTQSPTADNSDTWNSQIEALYRLGIGVENTLRYLYNERPSFEAFEDWVHQNTKPTDPDVLTDNVLTEADIDFWNANGYVIVRNAIPPEHCTDTVQAIWDFLGTSPYDETSWYKQHSEQRGLMLTFTDHETLNRNRLSARIRKAYEQLYKSEDIYMTIDKVSFNPPENSSYKFMGSKLHWDTSLATPIPFALQGLLYLTDCGPNDGAFHCVPGFHSRIDNWLQTTGDNPRQKALDTLNPIPIIANAGDFIIWDNRLPHCATPNHGKTPRMVQYLTYLPANYKQHEEWV